MKNVAIICGGDSGEFEISVKSAQVVKQNLNPELYNSKIIVVSKKGWYGLLKDGTRIDVDKNDFSISVGGHRTKFDVAFSLGGSYTAPIAWLRGKKSITFSDNDFTTHKFITYLFSSYFIFPSYLKYEGAKKRFHLRDEQIKTFNGFKEDIYIADYKVDEHFLDQLPWREFITIRPENLKAAYVPKDAVTIVPELFEAFKDMNVLFLPRYEEEKAMAAGYANVWYPAGPLCGLDVCYYTKAMLTGAGTFAREAALLGVPAVSFFPRKEFLTVDVVLQEQGKEFKSRSAAEIREYVLAASAQSKGRVLGDTSRSKKVLEEVLGIFDGILEEV